MKFVVFDLMSNHPNGVTGEILTEQERIQQVIAQAVFAETLGFDGYGVGERHGAPFLSSSPALMLTAIAARTSKIRLMPTISVLSVLDPVRVAEDYATLDHLSGGRLEMMIGKGNDPRHYPLFGIKEEEQWIALAERYDLLKRLWSEENVSWEGTYRPPIKNVTTEPRPYQRKIRIWHGSASSPLSTELAAKNGEPIFSSNAFHPMAKYKELIDHYRERLEFYGFDSKNAVLGAGAGSLYLANTKEEAINRYRPYYDTYMNTDASKHNQSPFKSLEDHVQNGSPLIGSPDYVVEKILKYHQAFGHQVQSISVGGISQEEQYEQLERFAMEVIPVLRREIPSTIWEIEKSAVDS
ncbi:LLM class flavin-dependent oxidoreductase [Neobacillus cucumis]|uniref:LLM class flavin-dependent oxidoreductase n=1 Tax=Neobacillus cucumis TaxID=1740721 RepID=UPI002040F63A|nr:LLM class flavin-dependent oxidoreductase [Neobacillus cucumis]MCM3724801.1 LLM class flavin-dependent oxidoreductase [Neobacillus cucumis]